MKILILPMKLLLLCLVFGNTCFAQTTPRTIKVTGSCEYNLSPNEIIIQLDFQEYFTDAAETKASKVKLEVIQEKIMASLTKAGVKKDKITEGGVTVVRPYKHNVETKRRLNKTLYVCVGNVAEFIKLTRTLEEDDMFDQIVTVFQVSEFKHTDKNTYLTKSRSEAYKDAVEKATLILSQSGQKLGKVVTVTEVNKYPNNDKGSFYSFDNAPKDNSGFAPLVISYTVEVTFEIE
jgi:uncharacterized protein YggE